MKLPKQWKLLVLVVLVAALFAIAWQTREGFTPSSSYILEDGKYIDEYVDASLPKIPNVDNAADLCNKNPRCVGITKEPGDTGFTLRAKASLGTRPGAVSYRKPANAWAAAGFSITPPAAPTPPPVVLPPAPTGGPAALEAPPSSVTPFGGSPAVVPPSATPAVEPTIVLSGQTAAGTYFLRKAV